jgi:hypothetical protein
MNATFQKPILIDKDQVKNLRFPQTEVLESVEEITSRKEELRRALILGNLDHSKVKIIFSDSDGPKMIETTVWAVTELRIVLKSGMVIPIHRIHEIIT